MSKIWWNYTKHLEKVSKVKGLHFFWMGDTETLVYREKHPRGCKQEGHWCGSHIEPCSNMEAFCCVPKYLIGNNRDAHWIIEPEEVIQQKVVWRVA